ncbi:hypothetical protein [Candidatus Kuenenia stuttgartiensis]|nr:hypothetical protein [Candidatus Kuenenia stuttgartiensis]
MNKNTHKNILHHFTELKVWQEAHNLYLLALIDVEKFPVVEVHII